MNARMRRMSYRSEELAREAQAEADERKARKDGKDHGPAATGARRGDAPEDPEQTGDTTPRSRTARSGRAPRRLCHERSDRALRAALRRPRARTAFYGELFGWDIQSFAGMDYSMVSTGPDRRPGAHRAGVHQRRAWAPRRGPSTAPRWSSTSRTSTPRSARSRPAAGTTLSRQGAGGRDGLVGLLPRPEGNIVGLWQTNPERLTGSPVRPGSAWPGSGCGARRRRPTSTPRCSAR